MQKHVVAENSSSGLNNRKLGMACLFVLCVDLLLALGLASAALNHLAPQRTGRPEGVTARLGSYLHGGQLVADVRTLAATFQFLSGAECNTQTLTNGATLPVAKTAAPNSTKS
jgi:hypothetical protein